MIFVIIVLSALLLFFASIVFAWAEAKTQARSEQRHGPNRLDDVGFFQLFADAYKVMRKDSTEANQRIDWYSIFTAAFPFVLVGYALSALPGINEDRLSMFTLLAILLVGTTIRARAEIFTDDTHKNFSGKNLFLLSVIGWLVFLTCSMAFMVYFNTAALDRIYSSQYGWPLVHFLKNPFLLISALIGFVAIFYLSGAFPLSPRISQNNGQSRAFLQYWAQKFWIMSILIVWCVVFFGGWQGSILGVAFFAFRLVFFSALMLWLQLAFMRVVLDDALGFALKWLMPSAILCMILEIVALGIVRS